MKTSEQHVHVVGVAGVGMSAIAQALLDAGYRVTGSDRYIDEGQALDVLDRLKAAGVELIPQDGSGISTATICVVVSTAIEADNRDLRRSHVEKVPVVHRAEMLARLAAGKRLLAVTGTAGKTTVTGMIGHICEEAGMDPVVVNGGSVVNWQAGDRVGSVRKGTGNLMIIEADESDRSLMVFQPNYVVITNISKDHFELEEVKELFKSFRDKASRWSILGPQAAVVLDGESDIALVVERLNNEVWFQHEGHRYLSPMPGHHNAENALLAVRVALRLGVAPDIIARALMSFRGIHRRLEVVGRANNITVLDDYAHNPAKIAASWKAAAENSSRVIGIWRPHGFAPLSLMFNEFVQSFSNVCRPNDQLFILPVYYAGGTASKTGDAERLVQVLAEKGVNVHFVRNYATLHDKLLEILRPGDIALGMGARDPELPAFLHKLLMSGQA
ncbi:MAG TPA: Mur ligase domain-containing protein [Kiritimatiellia bacterium]|nr:Mur ligase domain-containing protein [Kiritimatiellia bacterium]